jgi:hypothetical protein
MHVLFIAPDTGVYNQRFVDGLKRQGARVSGIGMAPEARLAPELRKMLDAYRQARSVLDGVELTEIAREFGKTHAFDRVETIDEPMVAPAAKVRSELGLPGLTMEQARLCRDKAAMKDALRAKDIPCAASTSAEDAATVHAFAEREGYPLVLKPREGFGTLHTFRVDDTAGLERALKTLAPAPGRASIVEEFVEGHEGFYDTVTAGGRVVHDFVGHYYPSCLEALQNRAITPRIACTNRVAQGGYTELRDVGQKVIDALGLVDCATHMEWFFGPKGLKVSEIGARPAGERIWDMHVAGNEFDLYGAWAETVLHGRANGTPTRRFAVGSVQIRPERDGRYRGHEGVDEVKRVLGSALVECEIPPPGAPTQPLEKGWHVNTWFRVRDTDYDRMRGMLEYIAGKVRARAG